LSTWGQPQDAWCVKARERRGGEIRLSLNEGKTVERQKPKRDVAVGRT